MQGLKGQINILLAKKQFLNTEKIFNFAAAMNYGSLAEWLGTGLQNRRRRFESARNLNEQSINA